MPWLSTTNQTLTLIIKVLIIIAFIVVGAWFFISILGNTLLADNPPELPDVDKARYQFLIKNTGEYVFTDDYSTDGGIYTLHGYYELKDGKYRWHDTDLSLDKSYFGPVQVKKR